MTSTVHLDRLTTLPLPPATYIPGRSAKTVRQQSRRWLAQHLEPAWRTGVGAASVRHNLAWLYGVDLFHAGCFWEAHEAWEPLWRAAPESTAERRLLHALLQWSASLLQVQAGRTNAAKRLALRALARARSVGRTECLGVNVAHMRGQLCSYLRALGQAEGESDMAEGLRPRLLVGQ